MKQMHAAFIYIICLSPTLPKSCRRLNVFLLLQLNSMNSIMRLEVIFHEERKKERKKEKRKERKKNRK